MPDLLFRAARVQPENYWRFGRILALLGIWYQSGLLLFMMLVFVGRARNEGSPTVVGLILAVLLAKNLALYMYSRSRAGVDDRTVYWIGCLVFDVGFAVVALPAIDPDFVRSAALSHFLGLHYALAAVLRWRSRWSYLSLAVPIAFFTRDLALYENIPERLVEAGGFFLLGVLFIVATREAFARNTQNVENRATNEYLVATELFAMNASIAALADASLDAHHEVITPLVRLGDALETSGRSDDARVIGAVVDEIRDQWNAQQLFSVNLSVGSAVGLIVDRLGSLGVSLRRQAQPDVLREFVEADDVERFVAFVMAAIKPELWSISFTVRRHYDRASGQRCVAFVMEQRDFTSLPDPSHAAHAGADESLVFLVRLSRGA